MGKTPFGSQKVITESISEAHLKTYFVGFDKNSTGQRYYRLEELIDLLQDVIPEFAFAHYGTINTLNAINMIREAAKSIYRIKEFEETRQIYENGKFIDDDEKTGKDKSLERGEFGELILHLLLRDFHKTIPLLSKIYFKDAYGSTVHGFDAVHVEPIAKTLWLGESKLYINPEKGLKALIQDIKTHFVGDYLRDEFNIISKKVKLYDNSSFPEREYWLDLMHRNTKMIDLLNSVSIPLLCTYSSENFTEYHDEKCAGFIKDYQEEIRKLKRYFDENNDHPLKSDLNIILLLFPVRSKNELVKRMHQKLYHLQTI